MFFVQQLSPSVRRVRLGAAGDVTDTRLPDPAIAEQGRRQLAAADPVACDDLAEAAAGTGVPLVALRREGDGSVTLEVTLGPGEHLYGAYDADAAAFDRRGDHVHLVTELHARGRHEIVDTCDLCDSGPEHLAEHELGLQIGAGRSSNYGELLVPFVISSAGWAIYVSSAWHGAELDLGAREPGVLRYTAPGGEADVYLFGPADIATLAHEFQLLTGRQPLPPAWALGFLQSRFGYENFDHVHRTIDRFETEQLPLHAIVYDVQWVEEHINLRWDPENFPDPAGNLARTAARGVRTLVITEPGTTRAASNYAGGAAVGAWATDADGNEFDSEQWYTKRGIAKYRGIEASPGALLNVFRDEPGEWWYGQHRPLTEQGVDAWWLDLNEPEDVNHTVHFPNTDWPASRELVSGDEVRGIFAIAQQRLFARGERLHTDRRPFMLSRAASAGSQRYGAAPWTGDVASTWADLAVQPRLLLTAGICGMPLTGSDAGGFNGDPGAELYVRWMQAASVLPIFRAHGYMCDREPWSQGEEALAALRPALLLRAQLLPSIVSWTRQALTEGTPLARAMLLGPLGTEPGSDDALAYAADTRWADCHDQWFFGPLLVAPVMQAGVTHRRVELPAGTEWVDLWSGESHAGGGSIEIEAGLDVLPIFLPRSLALVVDPEPLAGRGQHWPPPDLHVWSYAEAGATATTTFYLDDGVTRLHEQGAYCLQRIAATGEVCDVE
ncbi:MAG: hypothetical protein H7287_01765, partial [Thermoleophilia bacterium]|nr:hypothetical protein [Thermoleophilia bacterium]